VENFHDAFKAYRVVIGANNCTGAQIIKRGRRFGFGKPRMSCPRSPHTGAPPRRGNRFVKVPVAIRGIPHVYLQHLRFSQRA